MAMKKRSRRVELRLLSEREKILNLSDNLEADAAKHEKVARLLREAAMALRVAYDRLKPRDDAPSEPTEHHTP